jgi:hypothetical protein
VGAPGWRSALFSERFALPVRGRWPALAAAGAVALAAAAALAGHQLLSPATAGRTSPRAARARYVHVEDPGHLFTVGYPAGWRRLADADPGVVLLASGGDGGSLLVRETSLSAPVTLANLSAARRLVTGIVDSGSDVKQLRAPQEVTLGGLPGYLYLYTFVDPGSGQAGAHAHYFLFDGRTMITLVFQAMPPARILALAPLFDRIAATFHLLGG